jgi:hypothetical protein
LRKKKNLAGPDVIHSELKSAIRDSWLQVEHHVLAMDAAISVCPIRSGVKTKVTLCGVGFL